MEKKENILGTESIGKLLMKFSIPCIISMLVSSLYNIVDQIFIGIGVGYLGNGATNIVFPLTMVALAFALMFGDGASAFLSLKLGEKKKEEAASGVAAGILLATVVSIIFCIVLLIFMPTILNIFGCTDALRDYAKSYGYIIALGIPFSMIGTTLNSIIRSDGNPKYAMISMLSGAILNIALDPIFIFVLKLNVAGAALATIISQFVVFIINLLYIKKFKNIKLNKQILKSSYKHCLKVSSLGISSFITQMSFVVVIAFENNLLVKYGAISKFGSEIPITVLGIVMKISQIINSIVIGLAVGSQPILGYNYGARNYKRVKDTIKRVLGISFIISTVAFILFQTIPDKLILLFGSGNDLYIEFACTSFRIYLMLVMLNGIQIPSTIFFQAIGKSFKSAALSLSRQVLFLIPAMIILSNIFGLNGILTAGPVADGLAFIISAIFLLIEIKHLNKNTIQVEEPVKEEKKKNNSNKHIVITIGREYGSGGRYVGSLVAEKLGIKLYDKEFIAELSNKTGLDKKYIESNEQKMNALANFNNGYYAGLNNSDQLFVSESKLIKEKAKSESCVIVGRCADYILKNNKDVVTVFIYSSMEDKISRATKYYNLDKKKAEKEINKINKLRANHYKHYTNSVWNDPNNYDLCINSDTLGVEKTADIIVELVNSKNK